MGQDGRGPQREAAGLASDGKHLGQFHTELLDVGLAQLSPALPEHQKVSLMRTINSLHFTLPHHGILLVAGSQEPHHVKLPTLGDQQVIGVEHLFDLSLADDVELRLVVLKVICW